MVPWLRLHTFTAKDTDSVASQGTKIHKLQGMPSPQKKSDRFMGRSTVHIRDGVSPVCIGKRAWAESQETYSILYTALLPTSFEALSKLFKFFAFYLFSSSSKIL